MAKEFFWPGCVNLTLPGHATGVDGAIIYPIGVGHHSLIRRNLDKQYSHLKRRLLDPQFYLARLDPYACRTKCAYLAGYPWFPTKPHKPFDSGKHKQRQWQAHIKKNVHKLWLGQLPMTADDIQQIAKQCLVGQESLGCESFILPSPLTVDQGTDYTAELQWLDAGLTAANAINGDRQTLATIAVSDSALRLIEPWENELIDLIIDQVSSREPDGAYIVIEQANEQGYYCTHHNTIGCLLRLVHGLKTAGLARVVVAYMGVAGFLSLLAGADMWSSGWYKSERKLKLTDMEDADTIRLAYPAYYSHNFAGEFNVKNDLDSACNEGLLPHIRENTTAAEPLLAALSSGRKAGGVAEWEYEPANVTAAKEHFVSAAVNRTAEITNLTRDELITYGLDWLKNARKLAERVSQFDKRHERTAVIHQPSWHKVFREFAKKID